MINITKNIVIYKSQGIEVKKYPHNKLLEGVQSDVDNGWLLVHPLDDLHLIAGYAS